MRGCGELEGGDENGEDEEGEKDRGAKKGDMSPLEGLPGKGPLAHYASFPEDRPILVLVLKVCDSKALVFPKCKALKSGNL